MDPEEKSAVASDTIMLSALPEDAIESFVAAATAPGTSLMMAELRQLGGALGRPHPGGGAMSQFHGQFLVFAGGMAMTPAMAMASEADAMALTGSLTEWASGSAYLNFAENEMDASAASRAAPGIG